MQNAVFRCGVITQAYCNALAYILSSFACFLYGCTSNVCSRFWCLRRCHLRSQRRNVLLSKREIIVHIFFIGSRHAGKIIFKTRLKLARLLCACMRSNLHSGTFCLSSLHGISELLVDLPALLLKCSNMRIRCAFGSTELLNTSFTKLCTLLLHLTYCIA